jgi:dihydroxyacetone kinase DhaKLM complex PTS-EIIA-like component DhaM
MGQATDIYCASMVQRGAWNFERVVLVICDLGSAHQASGRVTGRASAYVRYADRSYHYLDGTSGQYTLCSTVQRDAWNSRRAVLVIRDLGSAHQASGRVTGRASAYVRYTDRSYHYLDGTSDQYTLCSMVQRDALNSRRVVLVICDLGSDQRIAPGPRRLSSSSSSCPHCSRSIWLIV